MIHMNSRLRPCALLLLVLMPTALAAQELGADWSLWRLNAGTTSDAVSTRQGATLRLGLPLGDNRSALNVGATFASESRSTPGLLHFDAEVASPLLAGDRSEPNVVLLAGVGALRFAADRQQAVIAQCNRTPLCMYEGVSYRSGWRGTLAAGVGADLPVASAVRFQPSVRVLRLVGSGDAGSRDDPWMLRLGIGVAWRR